MRTVAAADPRTRAPNKRELAKAETRQKILDSARRLFADKGYEAATVRDIATGAGMSTGAVFANFAGKADVFGEIVLADRNASYAIIEAVLDEELASERLDVDDALTAMFEAGYRFRLGNLALMQATISASWSPDLGAHVRERMAQRPIESLIAKALRSAASRGELTANADLDLLARMLWDCYLGNFAQVAHDRWPLDRLLDQLRRQMRIVLASARSGPALGKR